MQKVIEMTCSQLRMYSRNALKNKWWMAILVVFIYTSFNILFSYNIRTETIFKLAVIFNIPAILLKPGLTRCFLAFIRDEKFELSNLFFVFKKSSQLPSRFDYIIKCIGLQFLINLKIILWSFAFIIPGIITAYRYSQAMYIISENPQLGIKETMQLSDSMMQDKKLKLFKLHISFTGWEIINILTFGLLSIFYLNPYFICTNVMFYKLNCEEYYGDIENKTENSQNCVEV